MALNTLNASFEVNGFSHKYSSVVVEFYAVAEKMGILFKIDIGRIEGDFNSG